MSIILDEKEWARDAMEEKSLGAHPVETLWRVARYLRQVDKYSRQETRERLGNFLLQCDPNAIPVKWSETLDKLVKRADKFPLIELDGIPVTKGELGAIAAIEGAQNQQLAFTLLCVAKYWNAVKKPEYNNNWVNTPDTKIMAMANIKAAIKKQSKMLGDLRDAGFIRFSKRVDSLNIRVMTIDSGEPELFVTDFRNLGNQYRMYHGEPYIQCSQCGLTVRKSGVRQMYCRECARKVNIRKNGERRAAARAARSIVEKSADLRT